MGFNKKKIIVSKSLGAEIYQWKVIPNSKTKSNVSGNGMINNNRNSFCNATPYSQGQDWTTTYAYDLLVINGIQERSAYVECGYWE